ncbi:hypothetical protein Y696_11345 [Mesotoga sp. H07pep.5.4]|nr:hypothetical protein Y696_11345 [Mesotoga sp. H07pep.5.4]
MKNLRSFEKPWLEVRKNKRKWLTVESFSVHRGEPVARSRARICSSFLVEIVSSSIKIPTRSFVGMTESSLFAITVSCHPTEPVLKPCAKMLLFGVSCSGSSRTCFGILVLEKPWLGVGGRRLERAKDQLQDASSKL